MFSLLDPGVNPVGGRSYAGSARPNHGPVPIWKLGARAYSTGRWRLVTAVRCQTGFREANTQHIAIRQHVPAGSDMSPAAVLSNRRPFLSISPEPADPDTIWLSRRRALATFTSLQSSTSSSSYPITEQRPHHTSFQQAALAHTSATPPASRRTG